MINSFSLLGHTNRWLGVAGGTKVRWGSQLSGLPPHQLFTFSVSIPSAGSYES